MAILDVDSERVQRWCEERTPQNARDQLVIEAEFANDDIHIVERRAPWQPGGEWSSLRAATLRFDPLSGAWAIRVYDSNERSRSYFRRGLGNSLQNVLQELDDDPTDIFWG